MFCCILRYYKLMSKCLYDRLQNECGTIESVVYTSYYVRKWQPSLSTSNCTASE